MKKKTKHNQEMNRYLGGIDFLKVLDNAENPIGDLGLVEERTPRFVGEMASDQLRQAAAASPRVLKW